MWLIYDLIIHLYGDAISIAALFSPKARKWVDGRKGIFRRIESAVSGQQSAVSGQQSAVSGQQSEVSSQQSAVSSQQSAVSSQQSAVSSQQSAIINELQTVDRRPPTVIWFHCASLGEFEQGRPVMEAFRKAHSDWKIVLTFFSPSGYEIRKNYEGADHIFYLPLDTPGNAKKFIRLVRPSMAVFVKYEFWFRYLDSLHREKIPVYVISAIFRPEQHFFKWYGGWAVKQLNKVTRFFIQDEASADLLRAKGIEQVTICGDTRFDRVAAIAQNAKSFPLVEMFAAGIPVFLAGSTWPADEELIIQLMDILGDRMKFIIAPHEVHPARIEALKSAVGGQQSAVSSLSFSELTNENAQSAQILIIDGIGYLSHLYQYATIAYIGGGFGVGIHNILEAAAFGKSLIFGPKYGKFREAIELIEEGGAFSITDSQQLNKRTTELLNNPDFLHRTSEISAAYVQKKKGATGIILSSVYIMKSCSLYH
jgi:3-deoxy-D-manno-octulosonic-acid transferase